MSKPIFSAALASGVLASGALAAATLLAGCATPMTTYTVATPVDPTTGQATVVQSVQAKAPQNDSFVVMVYRGADRQPSVYPDLDSSALVDATAAAGKSSLQTVENALTPKSEH